MLIISVFDSFVGFLYWFERMNYFYRISWNFGYVVIVGGFGIVVYTD